MAANLTPQYMEAEEQYKKAQTAEERLLYLKKMFALMPKHKATDKLQADIKAKISAAKEDVEREKKTAKKGGVSYKIPKQGAGQYVILGAPNAGKSALVDKLTKAQPEVAPYPFTTHSPQAGMMEWEDVKIQLIDMPPITADFMEGFVSTMVRTADAAVLMIDLSDDDCPFAAEAVIERLADTKTVLIGTPPEEKPDPGIQYIRTLIVANKIDVEDAQDRLEIVQEMFANRFPIQTVSLETMENFEELRNKLFDFLQVIRVYTKQPGKPADMTSPFTCPINSNVETLAGLVHKDFLEKLKSARIWGHGVHDGQSVGREHILHDKDIVELHV